jgi:membrane protein implicated in regulation of membrane protease activity
MIGVPSDATMLLFSGEFWLILGLILIIIDIFLGSFFLLPIGVSAFIIAGLIYAQGQLWLGDVIFLETWKDVLIWFSVLSVLSIGVVKYVFQKKAGKKQDINNY